MRLVGDSLVDAGLHCFLLQDALADTHVGQAHQPGPLEFELAFAQ
jgi:hypothetical protein